MSKKVKLATGSIQARVDRGIVVAGQLKELTEELKSINASLVRDGLARPEQHQELEDAEREGRQWLATGSANIVPVVFTADVIMQSFQYGSPAHTNVRAAAGEKFSKFYTEVRGFKSVTDSGKKFRQIANELLGPGQAPILIHAAIARDNEGMAKSAVKVEWERAAAAEAFARQQMEAQ